MTIWNFQLKNPYSATLYNLAHREPWNPPEKNSCLRYWHSSFHLMKQYYIMAALFSSFHFVAFWVTIPAFIYQWRSQGERGKNPPAKREKLLKKKFLFAKAQFLVKTFPEIVKPSIFYCIFIRKFHNFLKFPQQCFSSTSAKK